MTVGLMQRVLASYRVPFFDLLAEKLDGGLSLFAGEARPEEMIDSSRLPERAELYRAENLHLFGGKAYLCVQRNVMDWLEQTHPDVLIQEANLRYPLSAAAARWMHRRNRPVIGWGLGTGKLSGPLLRSHLKRYDALLTYSSAGRDSYVAAGFPADKIFLAVNAAVRRPIRSMPQRKPDFDGLPVLLYVGRLQERKRPDLLIRACAALSRPVQPVIVGDGPIRSDLEALAAEIYPQTRFTGALYGDALTAEFDRADVFVMPGTGGLALQQAMASALPLVAAEADGTGEDLVRPENGVRIPGGDPDALTGALELLLTDPAELRRMGAASFRIVSQEANLDTMAEIFQRAVQSVI